MNQKKLNTHELAIKFGYENTNNLFEKLVEQHTLGNIDRCIDIIRMANIPARKQFLEHLLERREISVRINNAYLFFKDIL